MTAKRRLGCILTIVVLEILALVCVPVFGLRFFGLFAALAGLLLPMNWAVGCAVFIPVMQTIVCGSPYLTTDLPLLVCQMIALAAFTNFLWGMVGWNVYGALACAIALSLLVLFCAVSIFGAVSSGLIHPLTYVISITRSGWPWMLAALIVGPPAAVLARKFLIRSAA